MDQWAARRLGLMAMRVDLDSCVINYRVEQPAAKGATTP